MNADINFGATVKHKGYPGYLIARSSKLGDPAFLIAFPKPGRIKGETNEDYNNRLSHWAATFECNPETLGPCINRVVPKSEIEF